MARRTTWLPCAGAGCPARVEVGRRYCKACKRKRERARARRRGPTPYDRGWQEIRRQVLNAEPMCRMCGGPANEVDHIDPYRLTGIHDWDNLQPLCKPCHSRKTMREDGGHWGVPPRM